MSDSWLQNQLRRHGDRFRCAICATPSRRPAYVTMDGVAHSWSDWNCPGTYSGAVIAAATPAPRTTRSIGATAARAWSNAIPRPAK